MAEEINKTYTSNSLYNDSTGVIAFAEQLKQELINWANYEHVTEKLGPDNRPDIQNQLNNLFLRVYEEFLTFLNNADATDEAINTWKEIENFLKDFTDDKTLASIVAELNSKIESRLTVPLESTTGSSTTSTMTQKAITETIDASKTFTTGEKVDNVGIDTEPTAGSDNLVKSSGNYKFLAKSVTENNSPQYTSGSITPSGSIGTSTSYGYTNPIELKSKETIYLNKGNNIYVGWNISVLSLVESDFPNQTSSHGFIRSLKSTQGTYKVSYTNTSNETIYVVICAYYSQLPFQIEKAVVAAPNEEFEQLLEQTTDLQKTVDDNISNADYVDTFEGFGSVAKLIAYNGTYQTNNNQTTYYIPVIQGEKIKVVVTGTSTTSRCAFSSVIPAIGGTFTNYQEIGSDSTLTTTVFEAPYDGYFTISRLTQNTTTLKFQKNNTGLGNQIKELNNRVNSEVTLLDTRIAANTTEIENINYTGEFIDNRPVTVMTGYIVSETYGIAPNSSWNVSYIKVYQGEHLKVTVNQSSSYRTGFTTNTPASYRPVVDYYAESNKTLLEQHEFYAANDGYFCISWNGSDVVSFHVRNTSVGFKTEYSYGYGNDIDIHIPNYLFLIKNSNNKLNNRVQSLKLEGLLNNRRDLLINNNSPKSNIPFVGSRQIIITNNAGVELAKKAVSIHTTDSSVLNNKQIRYLAIGDSWCAAQCYTIDGDNSSNRKGAWGYVSSVVEEYNKLCIDGSYQRNMMLLGSIYRRHGSMSYKEQDIEIKGFEEGRGGWNVQSYLRHPILVQEHISPTTEEIAKGKALYDAIGLGRRQEYDPNVPYDDSQPMEYPYVQDAAHMILYLSTSMGYYHWDYSTEMMNYVCGISGTYDGTQKSAIDTAMLSILNNPTNPFYDWDTAISTQGEYAFNFGTYLSRWKTLADDGTTRLVVGSTAGTKITSSNINTIDVCTPTHVTIELGVNDYRNITNSQRKADLKQLATLVYNYDNNIKIGIVTVHTLGAFYPEKWIGADYNQIGDWDLGAFFSNTNGTLYSLNKNIAEDEDFVVASKTGICYIPTYSVMGVTRYGGDSTVSGGYYGEDNLGNKILLDGNDNIHPNIDVHKEIGYQILSWILYTLS